MDCNSLCNAANLLLRSVAPALFMLSANLAKANTLSWHRQPDTVAAQTLLSDGWRHNLEWVLTASSDGSLVLFNPQGTRMSYQPDEPDDAAENADSARTQRFVSATDGSIVQWQGERFQWLGEGGERVIFEGSVPVEIHSAAGEIRELEYENGRLRRVLSNGVVETEFIHANNRLLAVRDARGNDQPLPAVSEENPCLADPPERCDSQENPPDSVFSAGPSIPFATTLDIRPTSCDSYFLAYYGTDRGFAIEDALSLEAPYNTFDSTVRVFPSVDFVAADRLIIANSRDLAGRSFDPTLYPDALFNRLLEDAQHWQSQIEAPLASGDTVHAHELGQSTTLGGNVPDRVELHLVIRHGMALPAHVAQLETAREILLSDFGITLVIVEIP